jgi:hypothetical protein
MTSGSRLEIVSLLRLVGGFHGVWACSRVFWALSLSLLPGAPSGEVTDACVISQRDCFMMFLLVGDAFSRGMMRWTVYPTCCTGQRLTASR